jgi:hypothetical protein
MVLQSLQYSEPTVPVSGRSTGNSAWGRRCPGDWNAWRHFNSVKPVTFRLAGLVLLQERDTTRWLRGQESFQGDSSVPVTVLQWLQQCDTCAMVTNRFKVTSTGWHQCPHDWQVYRHFNKLARLSQRLSGLLSLQQADMPVSWWQTGLESVNMVTLVSLWLTGPESFQYRNTSVPVTGRCRVPSTGWHQCLGDRVLQSLQEGDNSVWITDRYSVTSTGAEKFPCAWLVYSLQYGDTGSW